MNKNKNKCLSIDGALPKHRMIFASSCPVLPLPRCAPQAAGDMRTHRVDIGRYLRRPRGRHFRSLTSSGNVIRWNFLAKADRPGARSKPLKQPSRGLNSPQQGVWTRSREREERLRQVRELQNVTAERNKRRSLAVPNQFGPADLGASWPCHGRRVRLLRRTAALTVLRRWCFHALLPLPFLGKPASHLYGLVRRSRCRPGTTVRPAPPRRSQGRRVTLTDRAHSLWGVCGLRSWPWRKTP